MTPQELYEIWAPPGALWSAWAKPVLFAQMYLSKRKPAPPPGGGTGMLTSDTPSTLDGLLASQPPQGEEVTFEPQQSFDWARDYRGDTAIVLDLPGEITV